MPLREIHIISKISVSGGEKLIQKSIEKNPVVPMVGWDLRLSGGVEVDIIEDIRLNPDDPTFRVEGIEAEYDFNSATETLITIKVIVTSKYFYLNIPAYDERKKK